MKRAVLDTNVLVSALMNPASPPGLLLDRWISERAFELLMSAEALAELSRVLRYPSVRRRIGMDDALLDRRIAMIDTLASHVEAGRAGAGIVRDPDDEIILALAMAGRADFIVTGDDDLLSLVAFRGTGIVKPREFLALIDQSDPEPSSVREPGATYGAGAHGNRDRRKSVRELLDAMARRVEQAGLTMTDEEAVALALEAQRQVRERADAARTRFRPRARGALG
jgi:putative PIN family toxin of toxin-antitoxin system